jgi:ketol-acid reductoisomerase
VRVSVDWPSRVGCGALAGLIRSGFALAAEALTDFDLALFAFGRELRAVADAVFPAGELLVAPAVFVPALIVS